MVCVVVLVGGDGLAADTVTVVVGGVLNVVVVAAAGHGVPERLWSRTGEVSSVTCEDPDEYQKSEPSESLNDTAPDHSAVGTAEPARSAGLVGSVESVGLVRSVGLLGLGGGGLGLGGGGVEVSCLVSGGGGFSGMSKVWLSNSPLCSAPRSPPAENAAELAVPPETWNPCRLTTPTVPSARTSPTISPLIPLPWTGELCNQLGSVRSGL